MSRFELRDEQARIVDGYQGGYAAIAAVPGAGKTTTLSALAARLVGEVGPRQRVVIVTYQNAAVANFQRAVTSRLEEQGLPPRGFVVRTLHSLANEVLQSVRHRAELDSGMRIIDEHEAKAIIDDLTQKVKKRHTDRLRSLLADDEARAVSRWPQGDTRLFEELIKVALRELRVTAGLDIEGFRDRHSEYGRLLPFVLDVCCGYQQALREQGALDYDGLIVRAVDALERDDELRRRLRRRWPYLLEDEAQDSTPLLERMLRLIAGKSGNLVRVGDPNQSILTTFTASDVEGFRRWLSDASVQSFTLTRSSRSAASILELANRFVAHVREEFPEDSVRLAALENQVIRPVVNADGTFQNPDVPQSESQGLVAREFERTEDEMREVVGRALKHLRSHPQGTVAILVGSRESGYEYAQEIVAGSHDREPFPDVRVIRLLGDQDGRQVGLIGKLMPIVDFLIDPTRSRALLDVLTLWSPSDGEDRVIQAVRSMQEDSRFTDPNMLYPSSDVDLAHVLSLPTDLNPEEQRSLQRLRAMPGWLANRLARPAELLSLIGATIGLDDRERHLMDAVIATVESTPHDLERNRLDQLRLVLRDLQKRQRKLRGTHDEHEISIGPGTLTISTRHQAKGLEWDVVFAVGCDDFWFKGTVDAPRRFQRGVLGLFDPILMMRTELEFAANGVASLPDDTDYQDMTARQAVAEISEGLRVLYVTLTRARQAVWLSWHRNGSYQGQRTPRTQALVFPMLEELVRELQEGTVVAVAD